MKRFYYILILSIVIGVSCHKNSPLKSEKLKVWGNCDKCKSTIEIASSLEGVSENNWNADSKLITLTYDTTIVSLDDILKSVARAGYDNDKFYGDDYAYAKLEQCCQYERKPFDLD